MIRLHVVVEGQTEEAFVNAVVVDHLGHFDISTDVRVVETGPGHKGGVLRYDRARRDLGRWLKEDQNHDARFTTLFDLYALPATFPDFEKTRHLPPRDRVRALEAAFGKDVDDRRFVPHLQLHEFEALVLCGLPQLATRFIEHRKAIEELAVELSAFDSPELVDDGVATAPSKRIIAKVPEYAGAKVSAGPLVAAQVGLTTLREKCPHFHSWISSLEHRVDVT